MRINRSLLNWGVFLIALGGVPLAVQQGWADASIAGDLWRLWPLILVGIGLGLILRWTPVAWLGGALVAGRAPLPGAADGTMGVAAGAAPAATGAGAAAVTGMATGRRAGWTGTATRGLGATTMRAHMPHMGCSPVVGMPRRERRRVRGPDCGGRKPQMATLSLPSR